MISVAVQSGRHNEYVGSRFELAKNGGGRLGV